MHIGVIPTYTFSIHINKIFLPTHQCCGAASQTVTWDTSTPYCADWVLSALFMIQLPTNTSRRAAEYDPSACVLSTYAEDTHGGLDLDFGLT